MEVGDKVKMEPMWKYEIAMGSITQVRKDGYIVVQWDGINGQWHYTAEQALKLEVVNEKR